MFAECDEKHIFRFRNTDELLNFLVGEWEYTYETAFELMQKEFTSRKTKNSCVETINLLKIKKCKGKLQWELTNSLYRPD